MKTIILKSPTLVKYSNNLNVKVEAGKEVDVEEEFLQTLAPDSYSLVTKKKSEKDIEIPIKKTKEITTEKKTK